VENLSLLSNLDFNAAGKATDSEIKAIEVWSKFLELIKSNLTELKYSTWFKPIKPKHYDGDTLTVLVPSQDFYEMIFSRFGSMISGSINAVLGDKGKVVYVVDDTLVSEEITTETEVLSVENKKTISPQQSTELNKGYSSFLKTDTDSRIFGFSLDPRYTFDNFVEGKNNEFAFAASQRISNNPGKQYNPFLIYGGVGLGKTHLLQAIANHLINTISGVKIMYTTGPEFTTTFIRSIMSGTTHEFERFYKSLDLLIVDDIQFLEKKQSTQDSFFQIFNSLYQLKRQIVLSCDKPPHQLTGLEERLITRFQWGLTVDIQPPDLETRIAILSKKCEYEKVSVPDDVLEFIAMNVKDNIRSLEGVLTGIIYESAFLNQPINIDLAKKSILRNGPLRGKRQNIDISTIISVVSKFFDIDESLIRLKTKRQEIVNARHSAMFLAKELTNCSLQTIGAHFGGRNHATVIHACKCIEDFIGSNPSFKEKIEEIKETLLTS
jgi:chromosomal replication initiator protein